MAYGGMGLFSLIFTGMVSNGTERVGCALGGAGGRKQSACRRIRNAAEFSIKPPPLCSGRGTAVAGAFGVWRARRILQLVAVEVPRKMPAELEGYRIAQISDLH